MLAQSTYHIRHKDGYETDIAISTQQLNRAQSGSDGDQKAIAIIVSYELYQNHEQFSRSAQRPYISFDDLIIEDMAPIGHRG